MYFFHDEVNQIYYMGSEEPNAHTYKKWLVDNPPAFVGADVETISLKERIAIGVGIAVRPDICFYFPLFPNQSPVVPWSLLRNPSITQVYHNGVYDLDCLSEYTINRNIMDTQVMSRLLCHQFNSLTDLSYIHQMETHDAGELLKEYNAKSMLDLPPDLVARKCMQDAGATLKLFWEFLPHTNMEYFKVEMATIPIMLRMTERGILIDQMERARLESILQEDVDSLTKICEEAESFSPGSPQQVSYILAKRGAYSVFTRLPYTKTKGYKRTGKLSSAEEILEKMDDPLAQVVLNYRRRAKLLSTYIKPWANETRATTRYHLDAITGRPSSKDRDMQNLPGIKSRERINVRAMLLPDSDTWTDIDFSQLELRILANLSQDREMLHIYESGGDIHQITADFMAIDRKICKNVNFAMIYGGSDETLMETAHIRDSRMAHNLTVMWSHLFPQAWDYIKSVQEASHHTNRARTMFGREMRLPSEEEESREGIERKAVNYPIQGTAADILKRSLILCQDMDIALQVHDELLIDGMVEPWKFDGMRRIAKFETPTEMKYLTRWE